MTTCPMCSKWTDEPALQIAELALTRVCLNRDQFFPGYCFVYTKDHVTELFHLEDEVRNRVMGEVSRVARALFQAFNPEKINYELLGNMVPHMHWHLLPRFATDPLWPRPHWSEPHQELVLEAQQIKQRVELIRFHLERG